MALWLSGGTTLTIFTFMPALHAFAYYGIGVADLHGLHPVLLENRFVAQFTALRGPGPHSIPMGELEGLVEFPSFHTTMSLLFVWALWPLRWLRLPVVVASLLSLSSTPIDGAHFFTDMIAGAAIAVAAMVVATRWARGGVVSPT
jgi:membrane-associated phospholipid phosphatase